MRNRTEWCFVIWDNIAPKEHTSARPKHQCQTWYKHEKVVIKQKWKKAIFIFGPNIVCYLPIRYPASDISVLKIIAIILAPKDAKPPRIKTSIEPPRTMKRKTGFLNCQTWNSVLKSSLVRVWWNFIFVFTKDHKTF